MKIRIKRIYEEIEKEDGFRILVDRLWPRGVTKEKAKVDSWMKEIAPSDKLRRWFGHDPAKWKLFRKIYFKELDERDGLIKKVREKAKSGVTLLFAAKDEVRNNAVALKEYLENG